MKKKLGFHILTLCVTALCLTAIAGEYLNWWFYEGRGTATICGAEVLLEANHLLLTHHESGMQSINFYCDSEYDSAAHEKGNFDLRGLKYLDKLREIEIKNYDVSLQILKRCKNLRTATLTNCNVADLSSASLEKLTIKDCTDMDWANMERFASLEVLHIEGELPPSLTDLAVMPNLKTLYFGLAFYPGYDLDWPISINAEHPEVPEYKGLPYTAEEIQVLIERGVTIKLILDVL